MDKDDQDWLADTSSSMGHLDSAKPKRRRFFDMACIAALAGALLYPYVPVEWLGVYNTVFVILTLATGWLAWLELRDMDAAGGGKGVRPKFIGGLIVAAVIGFIVMMGVLYLTTR